ncbi:NPC intracellular cholesterol transporter 1 homolog 1b [Gryllus bimaculatus]|nr:NPC intracellular cholesterol transporter 1 homolog 1b [Gryllus bimaculatus]
MAVRDISVSGHSWDDVCARYNTWFQTTADDIFESLVDKSSIPNDCLYQSLLKLWNKNGSFVEVFSLTNDNIFSTLRHQLNESKPKSILDDPRMLLSGVEWGPGEKVRAKATILNWMLKKSDNSSAEWELEFIRQALHSNRSLPQGMKVFAVSTRSYKDVLGQVLQNNITVLFAGFSLIILYVIIMLGRCNMVEQRILLSLLGVSVIGQSILASYGLCFYMGFFWGPLHPVLPFLLLGVGVDNIYVLVQCLDNLEGRQQMTIPERIGRTLQKAGVSITVTSLTDILAFAVGTSTVMPFLRSFCVFAATGILCLYVFEIFFFLSCLALDEKRIMTNRDCCYRPQKNWKPNSCSQRNVQKTVFNKYIIPNVMKTPMKVFILLTTLVLFSVNIWCVLQVEQKFDPIWYLYPDSYPILYNDKLNEYFPKYGKRAAIYMGDVNFYEDKAELNELATRLESNPYINKATLDIWYKSYDAWLEKHKTEPENEDEYKAYLLEFLLLTREGQTYIKDIKFTFADGDTDYNITAAQIPIQHIVMNTTAEQVKAMASIWDTINSLNLTKDGKQLVAFSQEYVSWTANKIIGEELLRNLGLTIAAVAMVTLILIQNLQTSFWVNCCVIFTVVDLVGSMYWLGLTIEISTSIMVLLCAGLAVDYAAHVGHEFTRLQGTKQQRAITTLNLIGTAIFNGGLSTFLAFALLGTSKSYLFTTFFKLFTGVVIFGLFHGLLFLPVILSWLGPAAPTDAASNINVFTVPVVSQNGIHLDHLVTTDKEESVCINKNAKRNEEMHTAVTLEAREGEESETDALSSQVLSNS